MNIYGSGHGPSAVVYHALRNFFLYLISILFLYLFLFIFSFQFIYKQFELVQYGSNQLKRVENRYKLFFKKDFSQSLYEMFACFMLLMIVMYNHFDFPRIPPNCKHCQDMLVYNNRISSYLGWIYGASSGVQANCRAPVTREIIAGLPSENMQQSLILCTASSLFLFCNGFEILLKVSQMSTLMEVSQKKKPKKMY